MAIEYKNLSSEAKVFFFHIENVFSHLLDDGLYLTSDILKEICAEMQEFSKEIDDPVIRDLYKSYSFNEVRERFSLMNNVLNATRNGTGKRGQYYFPFKTETTLAYKPENIIKKDLSNEEILIDQIRRFNTIALTMQSILKGIEHGMFLYGAGGMGKTTIVWNAMEESGKEFMKQWIKISGTISAPGLYSLAWSYRHKGNVIILDDADKVFLDKEARDMIKALTDDKPKRIISRAKQKELIDQDGENIPNSFQFEGALIIISNLSADKLAKDGNISDDFMAIVSRMPTIDININTPNERVIRLSYMIDHGILDEYQLTSEEMELLKGFLSESIGKIDLLCLRKLKLIARQIKEHPENWRDMVEVYLIK